MMRIRRALSERALLEQAFCGACIAMLALGALALTQVALAGPAHAAESKVPTNLTELEGRIAEAKRLLAYVVEEANKDPRENELQKYLSYGPAQMAKARGRVTAKDLLKFMADGDALFEFRERCMKAIIAGARLRGDVDLGQKKQGAGTARGQFFRKNVVRLLDDKNPETRALANRLLREVFASVRSIKAIASYSPTNKSTWAAARNEWNRYLRKR